MAYTAYIANGEQNSKFRSKKYLLMGHLTQNNN